MEETALLEATETAPDPALGGNFSEFGIMEEAPEPRLSLKPVKAGALVAAPSLAPETTDPENDFQGLDDAVSIVMKNYNRNLGYIPEVERAAKEIKDLGGEYTRALPGRGQLLSKLRAPKMPPPPQFQGRDEWQAFGSAGTVLAMFGSLFSRRPMTAAMNAAAASMEAIRNGDLQTYALQTKAWKDQSELALKQADMENGIIKTILDDDSKSWDQRLVLAKAYASSLGDKVTASAAASGDIKQLVGIYEKKAEIAKDLRGQIAQMKPERLLIDHFVNQYKAENSGQTPKAEDIVAFMDTVPDDKDAKQRNVNNIMRTYGVDQQTASSIVYGINKVVIEPTTQTPYLVNTLDGTFKTMTPSAAAVPPPTANEGAATGPTERTLYGMAPKVTGPLPAAGDFASRVPFVGTVAPEIAQARAAVNGMKGEFLRALSLNPRFPVAEMQRIEREIDLDPAVFDNVNAYRNRLVGIDDALQIREVNERATGNDNNLSVDARKNARDASNIIRNFRRSLGLPTRFHTDEETAEGLKKMAPGSDFIAPDGLIYTKKKK